MKPGIYVSYNGDFFDWPFLEKRAAHYGMKMSEVCNILIMFFSCFRCAGMISLVTGWVNGTFELFLYEDLFICVLEHYIFQWEQI